MGDIDPRLIKEVEEHQADMDPADYEWVQQIMVERMRGWKDFGWDPVNRGMDGTMLMHSIGLRAIFSGTVEADGKKWIHLSLSRTDGVIPTYYDLKVAKEQLLGDVMAVQVFPPSGMFVNIAEVLHLFQCLDGDPVPDFTYKGKSL